MKEPQEFGITIWQCKSVFVYQMESFEFSTGAVWFPQDLLLTE